ncbi:MAG: class I SAM-dependent methyltransferase [archaeon]|nr:class I SAM-dependent methyltransferase [archaeon]
MDKRDRNLKLPSYCGNRIRWNYVRKYLIRRFVPSKILDAGAGEGEFKELCEGKGYEYFGIDIEKRSNFVQKADICNIPFESETFDAILCVDVLEHVLDDAKAVKELKRVLKTDGYLLVHVPNKHQKHILIEQPEEQDDHVRHGYSPLDIKQLFFDFRSCNYYPTFDEKESIAWDLHYFFRKNQNITFDQINSMINSIIDDEKWQNEWINYGYLVILRK